MKRVRGAGALGHRGFLIYTIGNFLSAIGLWVQRLAIGWLGWTLSHSNLWVGLIAFAGLAPVLFLSPAFGVLVDRSDVRRASILVNGILMLLAAVLAVLVWTGGLTKELLLLLSLLVGTVSAAYTPVRLSLVAALVPRELMPSAVAATSIVFNLSRLIGPAVGGIVLASASAAWAFAINAVSFVPLMASLFVVKLAKADDRGEARHFLNELRAGFAHAGESLFLLWQLLITASLACLGRSALEVLPVYTTGFYGEGAQGLAALATAAAAGAIAASLACSQVELTTPQLQTATILLALLCGLCLLILPASRELWFGLAIFAMIGFAGTSGSIFSQTLVQVEVGNAFRARVTSLWGMATFGGAACGSLLLGALSEALGVGTATLVAGALSLVVPLLAWRFSHARRSRRAPTQPSAEDIL